MMGGLKRELFCGLGVNFSNSALKISAARFSRGEIFHIRAFLHCLTDRCEVSVAASADDAKSMREGASGIAVPEVVGRSAENLRNTGSALHAKSPLWHPRATNDPALRTFG
jgi:hypothetical protein